MSGDSSAVAHGPTRGALLLRSAWLVALGVVFGRVLVLNPHDNAYLAPATAGQLLPLLAAPFVVAALLPDGLIRRIAAWVAVVLVWVVGGFLTVIFLYYAVSIIGASLVSGKHLLEWDRGSTCGGRGFARTYRAWNQLSPVSLAGIVVGVWPLIAFTDIGKAKKTVSANESTRLATGLMNARTKRNA